jgi:hypothetical protein
MDSSYSYKFFDGGFMFLKAIRIEAFSLFNRPVKSPDLVLQSKPSVSKTADLIEVPNAFELIIHQRGGRQVISMTVHLCRGSADILLWRPNEDHILNRASNTIVVIVLLEYGGTLVAENPVSLSFSEMTCQKPHRLATSCE